MNHRVQPTTSLCPLQQLQGFGNGDGPAAANADVSEDPQVDAARQDDGQAQQQENEQRLWTGAKQQAGRGGHKVLAGCVGWGQKKAVTKMSSLTAFTIKKPVIRSKSLRQTVNTV